MECTRRVGHSYGVHQKGGTLIWSTLEGWDTHMEYTRRVRHSYGVH